MLSDGNAVVDISALKPEIPQFNTYMYPGKNISLFVIRMKDGSSPSWTPVSPAIPGYLDTSKDGFVVCRACDTTYSVDKLEKGLSGCYPVRIKGTQEGNAYRIERATLERHAGKF